MVSAIGGGGFPPPAINSQPAQSLSDEQKQFVTDTLKAFDSKSLSADDAQKITSLFRDQGIAPGRGLADVMAQAGFDAGQVGQLAGLPAPSGGLPPSGQPPMAAGSSASGSAGSDVLSFLSQLLEQQGNEPLSEDSKQGILQALRDRFGFSGDNVINERA